MNSERFRAIPSDSERSACLFLLTLALLASTQAIGTAQQSSQIIDARAPNVGFDHNQDGWDDFWVTLHYGHAGIFDPQDKFGDPDGDGVANFEEMRRFTDPFIEDPTLLLDAAAISERRAAQLQSRAVSPLQFEGEPTTLRESLKRGEAQSHREAIELAREQIAEMDATAAEAARQGLPLHSINDNGTSFRLDRFESGLPIYSSDCSTGQAVQVGANNIWNGTSYPPGYSGAGTTIGMWEVARTETTHQVFSTRLRYVDTVTTPLTTHGTSVAGVLAASGSFQGGASKGMSYQATIDARDTISYLSEMGALTLDQYRVQNHSHGKSGGWILNVPATLLNEGVEYQLKYWTSDLSHSPTEATGFGVYALESRTVDIKIRLLPYSLPVFASDNRATVSFENAAGYKIKTVLGGIDQGVDSFIVAYGGDLGVYDLSRKQYWQLAHGVWSGTITSPVFTVVAGAPTVSFNNPVPSNSAFDTLPWGGQTAKNTLVVGAVNVNTNALWTFSSRGPTDDGRIKPDIVAGGDDVHVPTSSPAGYEAHGFGTSLAAPCAAGCVNLLAQAQENLWGVEEALWASTYKALVIHTATDLGNPGPDYTFGWGILNADAAMAAIYGNYNDGDPDDQPRPRIKEIVLRNNETCEFIVEKASSAAVWATIAWTDPEGSPGLVSQLDNPASKLVNDMELCLIALDANGNETTTRMPYRLDPSAPGNNATIGINALDNVEQVRCPVETAVAYKVRIRQKYPSTIVNDGSGGQRISIILSNVTLSSFDLTVIDWYFETSSNPQQFRVSVLWNSIVGQSYIVQTSNDLVNWQDSAPVIAIQDTSYLTTDWLAGPPGFFRVMPVPVDPFAVP